MMKCLGDVSNFVSSQVLMYLQGSINENKAENYRHIYYNISIHRSKVDSGTPMC
ncbi:unnamed protein product [Amoebophrya sp. A25]|nr:unnamed protein product [Amoebophrya sp. A25]|eukprot:GSA25T00014170001.1